MNLLIGAVALYGMAVGGLYLLQDSMIFPRAAATRPIYPLPPGHERLTLTTATGERLEGVLVPARTQTRGLLLGFPGNAWNAEDCVTFLARRLPELDIAVFHYRGYEPSEGEPSEAALFADALLIHDRLQERLEPRRILAAGFSLGSGVAAYLAAHRTLDGLILVTPFDSIEAVAAARYPFVPIRPLLRHPFRSDHYLRNRDVPVAVIIASDDSVVPAARSRALVTALRRPVMVETIPGSTHGGIYDMPAVDQALLRAVDTLIPGS
jgi:pimeloyl-ACP methyl ester carboxylesterase